FRLLHLPPAAARIRPLRDLAPGRSRLAPTPHPAPNVTPAKAGAHPEISRWIPASAGMTAVVVGAPQHNLTPGATNCRSRTILSPRCGRGFAERKGRRF